MGLPLACPLLRCHGKGNSAIRLLGVGMLLGILAGGDARAVTPESPEVKELVTKGLAVLEKETDERLGGKCLVGLAFLKAGQPNHPRVAEAVEACRKGMTSTEPIDVYSNGLAVIFLCELAPHRYDAEVRWYLDLLEKRQKDHGGWGYDGNNSDHYMASTGDTSQTQYATMGYWEAYQHGFRLSQDSAEKVANWLLRTQDPNGGWGYQGAVSETSQRVTQNSPSCSMLAAGLGSLLICTDLFDVKPPLVLDHLGMSDELPDTAPPALRRAEPETTASSRKKMRAKRLQSVDLFDAIALANQWMEQNYKIDVGRYTYYYLYATERYQSFQELLEGAYDEEPGWYNDGYQHLRETQLPEGGWQGGCGLAADTSFAILFLLRSTQKSVHGTFGEGTLLGGRGLPANVARAKMRGGRIVVEQVKTHVDELLTMLDDPDEGLLDELARDPANLVVENVDEKSARRLQQLVRGGGPEVRLLAVRALARTGDLDYVPSLIYALTDPDRRIVLEARDGLQFMSRRFEGFGPPDDFTEQQRYEAVNAWKEWYATLRPGASVEP